MQKTILQEQHTCSLQKTARKNTKYWRKKHLQNRPYSRGYSSCKGYSLCKMVSFGQKLKMPKTCNKPFYKNTRVVLCKKTARKSTKYWRNETILKTGHLAKAIAHAKAIAFAKWSVWVKN